MSTILKALRRLEQEKASTVEGRPLREEVAHACPSEPARERRRWVPAVAALVVGLGIGAAIFAWLVGRDAPPAVASAPEPAAEAPATAPLQAAAAAAPATPLPREGGVVSDDELGALFGGPPEQAFGSDVEVVPRPEALPRLADSEPVQPAVPPKPGQRRPVEDSSAARRARQALADAAAGGAPPAVATEIAAAEPVPAPRPAPAPAAEPLAAEPAPEPKPVARAEPQPAPKPAPTPEPVAAKPEPRPAPAPEPVAAKPEPRPAPTPVAKAEPPPPPAPSLRVEKTLWHPQPERRRAWLLLSGESQSRLVVEGDVVDGLVVAEIEPSGVVLERDGQRFERGLGSR